MDILKIYKQAFAIVKKNKVLWIFGMALAASTGAGGFNFSNFSSENPLSQTEKFTQTEKLSQTLSPLLEYFKNLFFSIPISLYLTLGLGIIIALTVGLVISLIVSSWAKGAAIGAINDAYDEKKVTLRAGALYGIRSLKNMIWLAVVPWLLYFLALMVTGLLSLLFLLIPILGFLLILIIILIAAIASLAIVAIQIWAQLVVVIEGKTGKEAFFEGWSLTKKHFGKMILLGCSNCLLGCCLGGTVATVLGIFIAIGVGLIALNKTAGIIFLIILGTIVLVLLLLSVLFGGIFTIFNWSTWNILYRKIREGQKNG